MTNHTTLILICKVVIIIIFSEKGVIYKKKTSYILEVKVGYFGYVIVIMIGYSFCTFFIITLKIYICHNRIKSLQNFMLICLYV